MTLDCINSLFAKTQGITFEVILVDNASLDGSREFFEKDSRITYVYSDKNLGFGKANNLGYKYASGKYIFLLNSDTLLMNNAILKFYEYMRTTDSSIGCCGGILLNKDKERSFSYYKKFPTLWWIFQENLLYALPKSRLLWNPYKNYEKKALQDQFPLFVNHISGADLFIKRSVIEKCGLFDPDFFMYYEETEMQYRFQKKGYRSVVIDTPRIVHLEGASSSKKSILQKMKMNLKSRYLYAEKTFSPFKRFLFRLIHLILVPRLLLSSRPWNERKEILKIILK